MMSIQDAAVAAFALLIDAPSDDSVDPLWACTVIVSLAIATLITVVAWPLEHRFSRLRKHDRELIRRFGEPSGPVAPKLRRSAGG